MDVPPWVPDDFWREWRNAILDFAAGQDARLLGGYIEHLREAYPPQALQALMNLLSSHDQPRAGPCMCWATARVPAPRPGAQRVNAFGSPPWCR
jgi:hypothetical protein